ncbi:Uncharacterised protein [Bordetella pertussis]|nr:Uncharacterised protein [Bordetella pertussis]
MDATVETRVGNEVPSAMGTERYSAICSRNPGVLTLAMLLPSTVWCSAMRAAPFMAV